MRFAIIALLLSTSVASAQYRWIRGDGAKGDGHNFYLQHNGRWVGMYDALVYSYYPYDGQKYASRPSTMPTDPPTFGVDVEQISSTPRSTLSGREVTKDVATAAVGASIPDDSKSLRVTVIGEKPEREMVGQLLRRGGGCANGQCTIREYGPNDWEVKNSGFVTTGKPTTYVQEPEGKVIHRQDDPEGVVEAVRKAKESYDSKKDPDLRKTALPIPVPTLSPVLLACLGVGAYLFFGRKAHNATV